MDLQCGFMDSVSQTWLAGLQDRTRACRLVAFTVNLSHGKGLLPSTDHLRGTQDDVCFVAFMDDPAQANTTVGRWHVEYVEVRASELMQLTCVERWPDWWSCKLTIAHVLQRAEQHAVTRHSAVSTHAQGPGPAPIP